MDIIKIQKRIKKMKILLEELKQKKEKEINNQRKQISKE